MLLKNEKLTDTQTVQIAAIKLGRPEDLATATAQYPALGGGVNGRCRRVVFC